MHSPFVHMQTLECVVIFGLAIVLCSTALLANDTVQTCIPGSNISLYNELNKGTVLFPEVRLNFTSDQLLENSDLHRAQKLLNRSPQREDMNFNAEQYERALNDVCKRMIGKLSPNSNFTKNYKCPWEYKCDYDPRRIPRVLWQADCSQYSKWQCSCSNESEGSCTECVPVNKYCVPVYYPVPVLYTTNCSPYDTNADWKWQQIKVAVSCGCSNDQDFS